MTTTPLVCIDARTNRARRYQARREGGRLHATHEGVVQPWSPTFLDGLEAFRQCGDATEDESPEPLAA